MKLFQSFSKSLQNIKYTYFLKVEFVCGFLSKNIIKVIGFWRLGVLQASMGLKFIYEIKFPRGLFQMPKMNYRIWRTWKAFFPIILNSSWYCFPFSSIMTETFWKAWATTITFYITIAPFVCYISYLQSNRWLKNKTSNCNIGCNSFPTLITSGHSKDLWGNLN